MDPDKAVALGAAAYAGILEGEVRFEIHHSHSLAYCINNSSSSSSSMNTVFILLIMVSHS